MWKEIFATTSTSYSGTTDRDTPLRELIRVLPDLAEEFFDKCYVIEKRGTKQNSDEIEVNMNYDFIEDGYSKFDIDSHPLMIMVNEQKHDLLQHPLCLALISEKWYRFRRSYFFQLMFYWIFLLLVTSHILTSPSPISNPQLFSCTEFFGNITVHGNLTYQVFDVNSAWNDISRIMVMIFAVLWFISAFVSVVFRKTKKITHPTMLLDAFVFLLSLYITAHNFSHISDGNLSFYTDVRSCEQWLITAITIITAWLNLLIHMRLVPKVGIFTILFQEVLKTFVQIIPVFFVFLTAFALGFYVLLSNKDNFATPEDAMFKTMVMMAGELDSKEIFFKDIPPEGWGDQWDLGPQEVPFSGPTYSIFVIFFLLLSIVALNVLVGLIVDGIPNFLQNADVRMLSLLVRIVIEREKNMDMNANKTRGPNHDLGDLYFCLI